MVKRLGEILERKENRLRKLERSLPYVVEQLKALGAMKVILFGSLVRGATGPWSDLDVVAIMPPSLSSREWIRKIYAEVDRGIACDILAYTEQEMDQMLPTSSFLRHVLREGEVIYEARARGRGTTLVDPRVG